MSALLQALAAQGKWPLAWDKLAHPTTRCAVLRYIETCAGRDRVMRNALVALRGHGNACRTRSAVRRYLSSASARVHALATAMKKKHGALKDMSEEDILAIPVYAVAQSAWKVEFGCPIARPKLKRNGVDYRWIVAANVFQYAQELLTKAAVDAVATPFPTQFMSSNKGGTIALEQWLQETLPQTKRVITFDIPRCYALMKHGSVADALPLPRKVIDQVLFVPRARTKHVWPGPKGSIPKDLATYVQASSPDRGIAEGSALSAVASELVIAQILQDLASISDAVRVASYGDNLIVLVADASLKEHVINTLVASVRRHFDITPGELAGRVTVTSVTRRFEFCRRRYRWSGSKLRVSVSDAKKDWFVHRTLAAIQDAAGCKKPTERNERIARIRRSIIGWLRQYEGKNALLKEVMDLWAIVPKELPV